MHSSKLILTISSRNISFPQQNVLFFCEFYMYGRKENCEPFKKNHVWIKWYSINTLSFQF